MIVSLIVIFAFLDIIHYISNIRRLTFLCINLCKFLDVRNVEKFIAEPKELTGIEIKS